MIPVVATSFTTSFGPHLHYITIESAGTPRGAFRYAARGARRAALTPSSCRLHPGASPPAPLVCPAGAPPGISGIRVRAARATRHAPGPAFKSLAVDGPVAYPTVSHKLYTPCPNGRRDVVNRLSHAGGAGAFRRCPWRPWCGQRRIPAWRLHDRHMGPLSSPHGGLRAARQLPVDVGRVGRDAPSVEPLTDAVVDERGRSRSPAGGAQ